MDFLNKYNSDVDNLSIIVAVWLLVSIVLLLREIYILPSSDDSIINDIFKELKMNIIGIVTVLFASISFIYIVSNS